MMENHMLPELAFNIQQTNGDQLRALRISEATYQALRFQNCTQLATLLPEKANEVRGWMSADQLNELEQALNYFGLWLGMSQKEIDDVQNGLILPVELLT